MTSLLEGQSFERKKWDIVFDLSAPQIIIPEHFVDKEALIMVVDFGKFSVTNGEEMSAKVGKYIINYTQKCFYQMQNTNSLVLKKYFLGIYNTVQMT